jgi:hypothetical protein
MTKHQSKSWEPEPFRWLGVKFVTSSRKRMMRKVERTGVYPTRPTLAQRIWDF